MSAYQRLSRTPMFRRNRSSRPKDISNSADRVNHGAILILIHLAAQPMDQNIHDICLRIEAVIENVFKNHRFRHWTIGVAHQVLEQGKLAWLKLYFFPPFLYFATEQIQRETPHL